MTQQSNALWPAGVCSTMYGDNISTDTHPTREHAQAVCEALEREGFGGERKHFPVLTWVSDVQQPPMLPWRSMDMAPKDGTTIQLLVHHRNREFSKGVEKRQWEQVVEATWIDFNGGGWTWHGMYGEPQGWLPLPANGAHKRAPKASASMRWFDCVRSKA